MVNGSNKLAQLNNPNRPTTPNASQPNGKSNQSSPSATDSEDDSSNSSTEEEKETDASATSVSTSNEQLIRVKPSIPPCAAQWQAQWVASDVFREDFIDVAGSYFLALSDELTASTVFDALTHPSVSTRSSDPQANSQPSALQFMDIAGGSLRPMLDISFFPTNHASYEQI